MHLRVMGVVKVTSRVVDLDIGLWSRIERKSTAVHPCVRTSVEVELYQWVLDYG